MEEHVYGISFLLALMDHCMEYLECYYSYSEYQLFGVLFCFQVFATASYDDHKNIVLLAFEIIEKILREYFPYIAETESTTFNDCVNCLIAFTNSRFNKDISLNAIGFLRFCAAKLAKGDIGSSRLKEIPNSNSNLSLPYLTNDGKKETVVLVDKEDHIHFWFPLLAGNYVLLFIFVLLLLLHLQLTYLQC
jgi:brefeldin A-inhibited guanine nucleotide-exchange protein